MFSDLNHGITCVDADYLRDGLACFYVLQQGDELAVIETGTSRSVARLQQLMSERGLRPEQVRYVIPTHVHLDHAGGAGTMMHLFQEATLLVHPLGARHLINPAKLIAGSKAVYGEEVFNALYGEISPVEERRVREMNDGEVIRLAGRPLQFRDTPGHADHHFCIWDAESEGWFTGDTMGISYPQMRFDGAGFMIPTTTPVQFDPEKLVSSIQLLLAQQPRQCYLTHFGQIDNVEAAAEQMIRQVRAYRDIALAHAGDDPEERLTKLSQALWDYTLPELLAAGADASASQEFAQLLQFDMQLNAQGLDVWLARRARHSA